MSTAVDNVTQSTQELITGEKTERTITYTPFGGGDLVKLNTAIVRRYLAKPTRAGQMPTDADIMQYMMLCRSRGLDPWIGDAFLVGYDSQDGPQFSLITSLQALLTRAELHEQYDGLEAGVVVETVDKQITERPGEIVLTGEQLIGAWARVYRKDRSIPIFRSINRGGYDKGRSMWRTNPAGMLVKCAKAAALRDAFPKALGGLHTADEAAVLAMADEAEKRHVHSKLPPIRSHRMEDLVHALSGEKPSPSPSPADISFTPTVDAVEGTAPDQITDVQNVGGDEELTRAEVATISSSFRECESVRQVTAMEQRLTNQFPNLREDIARMAAETRHDLRHNKKNTTLFGDET